MEQQQLYLRMLVRNVVVHEIDIVETSLFLLNSYFQSQMI